MAVALDTGLVAHGLGNGLAEADPHVFHRVVSIPRANRPGSGPLSRTNRAAQKPGACGRKSRGPYRRGTGRCHRGIAATRSRSQSSGAQSAPCGLRRSCVPLLANFHRPRMSFQAFGAGHAGNVLGRAGQARGGVVNNARRLDEIGHPPTTRRSGPRLASANTWLVPAK